MAQRQINSIESDHLLAVLLDVPIYIQDLDLLQLALERKRIQFLNNERINGVISHVWHASAFLDPIEDIEKRNQTVVQLFRLLFERPFQFYLTPMGFNITVGFCYIVYMLFIVIFLVLRLYPEHPLGHYEAVLWVFNVGYVLNEVVECMDQGRQYFAVNGLENYLDMFISMLWILLAIIRAHSVYEYHHHSNDDSDCPSQYCFGEKWYWLSIVYVTLWALQTVMLFGRSLFNFMSSKYMGILIRSLQLMMGQIVRFFLFLVTIWIGFTFGLYYIDHTPQHPMYVEGGDMYQHILYFFTTMVGMAEIQGDHLPFDLDGGELDDVSGWMIAITQIYSILFILIGTIMSMNLLIALMTAKFNHVQDQANTEYASSRAELTYGLSHRNRMLPPPFIIFSLTIAAAIHIINFLPALLFPDTLNIYYYLATDHYHKLRSFNTLDWICCCSRKRRLQQRQWRKLKRAVRAEIDREQKENSGSRRSQTNDSGSGRSRCRDRFCGTLCCWFRCYWCFGCKCCEDCMSTCRRWQDSRKKKSHTFLMNTSGLVLKYYILKHVACLDRIGRRCHWNVYHSACYNCIAKQRIVGKFESHKFHGIAMNKYFEIYEKQRKTKLDATDKNLLKHLTVNTLFCQYCYRPFDKEHIEQNLITPFGALADIVSCYCFLVIWFFLVVIWGVAALLTVCVNSCSDDLTSSFSSRSAADGEDGETDEFREYDREYFRKWMPEVQDLKVGTSGAQSASDWDHE